LGALPLLGVLALEAVCYRVVQARVEAIAAPLDGIAGQLDVLARVLERVEREPVASPWLVARVSALRDGGAASRRIAALARAIAWLEARKNALFAPFAYGLMWAWHFTLAVERWRARSGPRLRTWFTALGEFEAMAALAGYAYERPGHPFPELRADGPLLVGEALGHPLLSEESCVTNDVALGEVRALIVSGSNMSGKSTLLRTVGANVVLALAGAPVRARRLTLSPLQLAASIRVQDSLREGHSRFYAELLRLRGVVERARGEVPALFLLDEILHGTNSHDRRIGAQALVCGLVEAGAIGLVTTHDLALTRVVETLEGKARNVHFEDELVDGALRFDYRMREGVVTRSNALELMRAVGLDV
ncbi:MAG: DNA mismatch repair protein MutS, partial [Myxococcales bacterium]|nr:DNA mismatch repair protein MutS [Myxococcales bacterium]